MFRRSVMLTALASAMVVVLVAPAGAVPRSEGVNGPFHATGTLDFGPGCEVAHQTVDGVIQPTVPSATGVGPVEFHLEFCVNDAPDGVHFPSTGTFVLSLRKGKVTGPLSGFVEGLNLTPSGFPLNLVLTVTGGTRRYHHAAGTVTLEGFFSIGGVTADGTATGSISK
jgi:hypothetical protein